MVDIIHRSAFGKSKRAGLAWRMVTRSGRSIRQALEVLLEILQYASKDIVLRTLQHSWILSPAEGNKDRKNRCLRQTLDMHLTTCARWWSGRSEMIDHSVIELLWS